MAEGDAGARVRAVVRAIAVQAHDANIERAARLESLFESALRDGVCDTDREAAAELAHQLVGSAGTFGYPAVSVLAGELEKFFAENGFAEPERVEIARDQLRQLQTQLAVEPSYIDGT